VVSNIVTHIEPYIHTGVKAQIGQINDMVNSAAAEKECTNLEHQVLHAYRSKNKCMYMHLHKCRLAHVSAFL